MGDSDQGSQQTGPESNARLRLGRTATPLVARRWLAPSLVLTSCWLTPSDALSVMPNVVSGNTNAASIMIGEKAAEMIARDHSIEISEFVGVH